MKRLSLRKTIFLLALFNSGLGMAQVVVTYSNDGQVAQDARQPMPHHHYSPHQQFNPPSASQYWRAGYTNNTSCTGSVTPMSNIQYSNIFAPMVGYAFGPGQSNNDLPVVLKNPNNYMVAPNLRFAPNAVVLHGSAARCAVLSFIAPRNGVYQVQGSFHKTGNLPNVAPHPMRAGVFISTGPNNNPHIFSGFVSVTSNQVSSPFNLSVPLSAGQELNFMSNIGGVLNSNTVGLTLNVNGP